jgi:hypothetical protein
MRTLLLDTNIVSYLLKQAAQAELYEPHLSPIVWNPPYVGSQKYLLPDLVLERESETLIIDAKFKGHWEELQRGPRGELDDALREHHRADLLQVLAY